MDNLKIKIGNIGKSLCDLVKINLRLVTGWNFTRHSAMDLGEI